jgi:hypothetical protein
MPIQGDRRIACLAWYIGMYTISWWIWWRSINKNKENKG